MTREIALHCMKSYSEHHSDLCELCPIYGQTGDDHCFEDALQYVIGMLEQGSILDKIRAEILEEHENAYAREDNDTAYGLSIALDILDKYKAETEETDGTNKQA